MRRGFSLVEIMVVVTIAAALAAAGMVVGRELLGSASVADESRAVVSALRKTRGEALRTGTASAVRIGGGQARFALVDSGDGCRRFAADPDAARRIVATKELRHIGIEATQTGATGATRTACFSSTSFMPLDVDGVGPLDLSLQFFKASGRCTSGGACSAGQRCSLGMCIADAPIAFATVGGTGAIDSTFDTDTSEGIATTGIRVAPTVDLVATTLFLPPTPPTPPLAPADVVPPPAA